MIGAENSYPPEGDVNSNYVTWVPSRIRPSSSVSHTDIFGTTYYTVGGGVNPAYVATLGGMGQTGQPQTTAVPVGKITMTDLVLDESHTALNSATGFLELKYVFDMEITAPGGSAPALTLSSTTLAYYVSYPAFSRKGYRYGNNRDLAQDASEGDQPEFRSPPRFLGRIAAEPLNNLGDSTWGLSSYSGWTVHNMFLDRWQRQMKDVDKLYDQALGVIEGSRFVGSSSVTNTLFWHGTKRSADYVTGLGTNSMAMREADERQLVGRTASVRMSFWGLLDTTHPAFGSAYPTITVAIAPPSAVAEDSTTGTLVYTLTRTGSTSYELPVNFTMTGTATPGNDYNPISGPDTFGGGIGTITIPRGASTVQLVLHPTSDMVVEANESAILRIDSGPYYTIGTPSEATGTITNDDVVTAPEIALSGNGQNIPNGKATPTAADHTEFGSTAVAGGTVVRTFTISNSGTAVLNLTGTPRVGLGGSTAFTVTSQPAATMVAANGGTLSFQVTYDPAAAGLHTATVSIASNDGDENPFTFTIQGTGTAPSPEIALSGNGQNIPNGKATPTAADHTDFGSTNVAGGTMVRTFTISNTGTAVLNLTGSPRVAVSGTHAADFTVTVQAAPTVAAGSGNTTFNVVFNPGGLGPRTATLSIATNDADENPFTFAIRGVGTSFYITEAASGVLGDGQGSLSFGNAAVGSGSSRTFVVYNDGSAAVQFGTTVTKDGANPADFTVALLPAPPLYPPAVPPGPSIWQFALIFQPTAVGARACNLHIFSSESNTDSFDINLTGTGLAAPDIGLSGNGQNIPNGKATPGAADHTDFGSTAVAGGTVARTFTISNSGTAVLNLTGTPRVSLSGSSAFIVTAQPAAATVAAGGGTLSFQVTYDPAAAGASSATVSIASNDADENPFTFSISGEATESPPLLVAQQAYLKASNTGASDTFGTSVAVSGTTVVVGAPSESGSTTGVNNTPNENASGAGAVYVFVRDVAGNWSQQAYLKAGNTGAGDRFGSSVAISGDTVVVGADGEDSSTTGVNSTPNESAANAGAAYVFVRSGGSWSQQAYLKASNAGENHNFGTAVAVSGDTVVVGATGESSFTTGVNSTPVEGSSNSGAAYVFLRSGGTWNQQAYLKASNTGSSAQFGLSVAASGDTVVIGAYGESSSTTGVNSTPDETAFFAGAAYVFVRSGSSWSQQAYLKASNTEAGDGFGFSVAISGDTAVIGALGEDGGTTGVNSTPNEGAANAGAAYVFVRTGGTWSQRAYLKAGNAGEEDKFGSSVTISGDAVVVGAYGESSSTTGGNSTPNENASYAGAAYVFVRNGGTWGQLAYLKAGNTGAYDYFGRSLAVSGDTLVIGAYGESSSTMGVNSTPNENASFAGAAYVFTGVGSKPPSDSMDGLPDSAGYLLLNAAGGMKLYAAVRGNRLYVATDSPGSNGAGSYDTHVLISDALLSANTTGKYWAKSGLMAVSNTKPLLGGESINDYAGWANAGASAVATKSSLLTGVMEGSLDLVEAFGSLPSVIYLAAAAHATADAGSMLRQAPAGNGDQNLDRAEFLSVPLEALVVRNANGVLDRLDPDKGFRATATPMGPATLLLSWPVVPGLRYQPEWSSNLTTWLPLGAVVPAASGDNTRSVNDTAATGLKRFYRVRQVP